MNCPICGISESIPSPDHDHHANFCQLDDCRKRAEWEVLTSAEWEAITANAAWTPVCRTHVDWYGHWVQVRRVRA